MGVRIAEIHGVEHNRALDTGPCDRPPGALGGGDQESARCAAISRQRRGPQKSFSPLAEEGGEHGGRTRRAHTVDLFCVGFYGLRGLEDRVLEMA